MPSDGYASWTIIVAVAGFWISLNVASWVATKFRNNNNNNNNNNLIPGRRQVSRLTGHVGVAWLWLDWHCDDTATVRTSAGATPIKRPQSYNTALSQYLDFGIIACSLLLVLTPCWLLLRAGHLLLSTTSNAVSPLVDHGTSLPILIPGVTTPLRDVPAMLLAGFLAVVWHEAGHALAARACSMTIRSIGFVFILAFPGAYVSIDTPCLDDHNYSPTDHLRVVLAGVLNNAAFWLVSQMVYASVIGSTIGTLLLHVGGFTNVNEVGVAVQIVDNSSPLRHLLTPGDIITHLDDMELHDSATYHHWDRYLKSVSQSGSEDQLGWCITTQNVMHSHTKCCDMLVASPFNSTTETCFQSEPGGNSESDGVYRACLEPSQMLGSTRCLDACQSEEDELCMKVSAADSLLRLTFRTLATEGGGSDADSTVVFYKGDKNLIHRDVFVGVWLAPPFMPASFLYHITAFGSYLMSTSFSLAILNILPLPHLDGSEALALFLSLPKALFGNALPLTSLTEHESPLSMRRLRLARKSRLHNLLEMGLMVIAQHRYTRALAKHARAVTVIVQTTISLALLTITFTPLL